jgi:hypothetical protein
MILQDVPQKVVKPVKKRQVVHYLMSRYGIGVPLRTVAPLGVLLPQLQGRSDRASRADV